MPQILKDGSIKLVKRERDVLDGAADILRTVAHLDRRCYDAAGVCGELLDGKIRKEVTDGQESSQGRVDR